MSGDKLRNPHISWVFAQLVTFPIFGRGATWGWPSQSRLRRASVSAAASGAVCQWQTSSTDRRGSGDRPLGNVPPGRSGPQGGSQVSPPPLGEVSCLWHDGEGNLPTPCTCVSGSHRRGVQPPVSPAGSVGSGRSPLGSRTPRRESTAEALRRPGKALRCFPSFLLCAARLEGQVQGRTFFEKKAPQKTLRSLRSAPGADVRYSLAQARRSAAAQWRDLSRAVTHRELRAQALGRSGKTLRCFPSFLSCAARL